MKSEREMMVELAGHALAGILASPEWMALAKKECVVPGQGDVPDFLAEAAALYAHRTLAKIDKYLPHDSPA